MSAPKHTPEPWRVFSSAQPSCIVDDAGDICRARSPLDAARIVACVNYCAGTPTEQLNCTSDKAVRTGSDALDRERLLLTRERDELAAALLEASRALMVYEGLPRDRFPGPPTTALRMARAALAKLDGAS